MELLQKEQNLDVGQKTCFTVLKLILRRMSKMKSKIVFHLTIIKICASRTFKIPIKNDKIINHCNDQIHMKRFIIIIT